MLTYIKKLLNAVQEISQVQYTICEILNVDIYKKTVKRNSIYSILFPFGIYVEVLKE